MGVVLVGATCASYVVVLGDWYEALQLPHWFRCLPLQWIWSLIYALDIFIMTRIVYATRSKPLLATLGLRGMGRVVWCACFFRLHSISAAFGSAIGLCAAEIAVGVWLFRREKVAWAAYLWQSVWLGLLTYVNYRLWIGA